MNWRTRGTSSLSYRYEFGSRQRPDRKQVVPRSTRPCACACISAWVISGASGTGQPGSADVACTNGSSK
jgi:hypothetical protein